MKTGLATPLTAIRPGLATPGPSSLRRLVTSRSDVFLTRQTSRNESYTREPPRRMSGAGSSSAARTSGSSWDTDKNPTRSGTMSTKASSQLASRPVSISKGPINPLPQGRARAPSLTGTSPGKSFPPRHIGPGGITLPLNNSVSQLATLSHSAHTLSPYARAHEHIAVRSFPHLGKTGPSAGSTSSTNLSAIAENQPGAVKARRKRIFHLSPKEEVEPISPDLDGSYDSPSPTQSRPVSVSYGQRSRSPSDDFTFGYPNTINRRPVSLTGVVQKVMRDSTSRPNYGRAPDSRTSYGFPTRM